MTHAPLCVLDIRAILQRLGSDEAKLKESVLIGCSEQNQAQFCLDVGKPSWELVNWSPLAFLGLRLVVQENWTRWRWRKHWMGRL